MLSEELSHASVQGILVLSDVTDLNTLARKADEVVERLDQKEIHAILNRPGTSGPINIKVTELLYRLTSSEERLKSLLGRVEKSEVSSKSIPSTSRGRHQ